MANRENKTGMRATLTPTLSHRMGEGEEAAALGHIQAGSRSPAARVPSPLGGERVRVRGRLADLVQIPAPWCVLLFACLSPLFAAEAPIAPIGTNAIPASICVDPGI